MRASLVQAIRVIDAYVKRPREKKDKKGKPRALKRGRKKKKVVASAASAAQQ